MNFDILHWVLIGLMAVYVSLSALDIMAGIIFKIIDLNRLYKAGKLDEEVQLLRRMVNKGIVYVSVFFLGLIILFVLAIGLTRNVQASEHISDYQPEINVVAKTIAEKYQYQAEVLFQIEVCRITEEYYFDDNAIFSSYEMNMGNKIPGLIIYGGCSLWIMNPETKEYQRAFYAVVYNPKASNLVSVSILTDK